MKRVLGPEAAIAEAWAAVAAGQAVGILFGRERVGLDNDEIALADAILTFPVDPAFASLNLAQAVLLVAYEWRKAASAGALPFGADWKNTVFCEFDTSAKSKMRLTDRPSSAPGSPLNFWLMRALK